MLPLTEAASFVDALWVCKYCSTRHMIEDVVPRFRKALFDRIKDMTDLELRVRKWLLQRWGWYCV
jgi:hypothetical protein